MSSSTKTNSKQRESDAQRIERLERFFHSTDFEQHTKAIAAAFAPKPQPAASKVVRQ